MKRPLFDAVDDGGVVDGVLPAEASGSVQSDALQPPCIVTNASGCVRAGRGALACD